MHMIDVTTPPPKLTRRGLVSLLAFRFASLYLLFWVLATQMMSSLLPFARVRHLGGLAPLREIVVWAGTLVFNATPRVNVMSGMGGDTLFDWVQMFCLACMAAIAAIVWSLLDRHRYAPRRLRLHAASTLFVRFALGATLVQYGMTKAMPLQMGAPSLTRLVEPFGHFSPMGLLWTFMGASTGYQSFTGIAELLAAALLFVPMTATLGALLALGVGVQVFALNLSYDVPVKLLSFHLILMSLFLLAPHFKRLITVLVLNAAAEPVQQVALVRSARMLRILLAVQIVFGAYLIGSHGFRAARDFRVQNAAERSPLYGIWDVQELVIDGIARPLVVTDHQIWRRAIFDGPSEAAFQRMDDTFARYIAHVDIATGEVAMRSFGGGRPPQLAGRLSFTRATVNTLFLEGELEGHRLRMRLQLYDLKRFVILSRGFNWVQEVPFNR